MSIQAHRPVSGVIVTQIINPTSIVQSLSLVEDKNDTLSLSEPKLFRLVVAHPMAGFRS